MGFSSYDDLITEISGGKSWFQPFQKTSLLVGVAGAWYNSWQWTGNPPAGAYAGSALDATQTLDTTAGALYHGGNVSADTKHLVAFGCQVAAATAVPGAIMVVDKLLHYPQINANSNSLQNMTQGAELPRYTDGKGVMMLLDVTTALGATASNLTVHYSNTLDQDHVLGSTVNMTVSSAIARVGHSGLLTGNFNPFLPLAAGDLGVKTVISVTFGTAMLAGVVSMCLVKPLCYLPLPAVNVMSERDFVFQIAALPRIYDGACLSFIVLEPGALAATTPFQGYVQFGWG